MNTVIKVENKESHLIKRIKGSSYKYTHVLTWFNKEYKGIKSPKYNRNETRLVIKSVEIME